MINQENIIGSIIGSTIATIGSILVWVIIDQLKKYFEKRKDSKNFIRLYNLFAKEKLELHMGVNIENLFEEIGFKKIQKVLKFIFQLRYDEYLRTNHYIYENQLFKISLMCADGYNEIYIQEGDLIYDYKKETTNLHIKINFLKFFEDSCKNEKIKLKLPKIE
ncbi:MAG: hypothetical protein ACFFD2_14780 [Promethearchaeota archaeon]